MINLNEKLLSIIAVLIVFLTLNVNASAQSKEELDQVAENVYRYGQGKGVYSMFVVTDDGVIVIDPISSIHAEGMLKAIKKVTDKPVKYLLNSHNHWDHANGGKVFQEVGAVSIAHKNAYDWMTENPHPDLTLPTEVWTGSRYEVTLGKTTIELHFVGLSHGHGMTVFLLPDQRMAYIADLISPGSIPFATLPDFNINEFMKAIERLEKLDFETAIYSHTATGKALGTKQDMIDTKVYFQDLQNAIITELKKGTNFMKVPDTIDLPKYKHLNMYDEWLSLNAWTVMTQMSIGPYPWHNIN